MTRSCKRLLLCGGLLLGIAACGGDEGSEGGSNGDEDAGNESGGGSGGGSSGSDGGGTTTATTRIAITDAKSCAGDDPTTPGIECEDVVSCGGTAEAPHTCPKATHSCCVSGPPKESTVNCYEGKTACNVAEAVNTCDGPEDCGDGQICCVTAPPNVKTQCVVPQHCYTIAGESVFCHADADCPAGQICNALAEAPFWGFCG